MTTSRRLTSSIPRAALVTTLLTPALAAEVVTVETIADLRSVTDATIDPSGERVAYVLSVPRDEDDEPGRSYAEIWIQALDDSPPRRFSLQRQRAAQPRWTPDGRSLAYVGPVLEEDWDGGERQVHLVAVDGGAPRIVTRHETSIGTFRFAPDGRSIAFTAGEDTSEADEAAEASGEDWIVVDEPESATRLWVADAQAGVARMVSGEYLSVTGFTWSPDGATLVFTASVDPSTDAAMMYAGIYRLPSTGGTPAFVCPTAGKLGQLAVSPDGTRLAFMGATSLNDPLPQSLLVTPMEGNEPRNGRPRNLTRNLTDSLEGSVTSIDWTADGRVLMLANEGTKTTLSVVDPDTGARRTIVGGPDNVLAGRSLTFSRATSRFCLVHNAPSHPSEVGIGSLEGDRVLRLTDHNPHLADLDLARAETIEWTAEDGWRIEGVVTYPPGFAPGRPAPLVVNPHGGPEGTTLRGWSDQAQLLAAHGFVVLQPNYRGSGGRGVTFSKGDHDDLGGQEFRDILAGVDALIECGVADPDRIGMGGWSYGGYLSAMAATHHSGRFKAAIMGAGISNWVSFTGTTDIPDEMSIVHWNRPLLGNEALYWERSPLSRIADANTPTLIIFGAEDDRVPPSQGAELHHALRKKGVPTEFVLYPREPHGIGERAHRLDLYARQVAWFERWLGE